MQTSVSVRYAFFPWGKCVVFFFTVIRRVRCIVIDIAMNDYSKAIIARLLQDAALIGLAARRRRSADVALRAEALESCGAAAAAFEERPEMAARED